MASFTLEPYQSGNSSIHDMDARLKLPIALANVFLIAILPASAWQMYIVLFTLNLAVAWLAGVKLSYFLKRSLLVLPFALAALPIIFTLPGATAFSFAFAGLHVPISQNGLIRFGSICAKSWLSVQAIVILTATTSMPDLLKAMRAFHLPRLLVAITGLMWRYLFVIVEEASRLLRARTARSGCASLNTRQGGTLVWRARVTGGMAGSLFLRSIERSERVYAALLARGYDGETRSLPVPPLPRQSRMALTASFCFMLGLFILSIIFT